MGLFARRKTVFVDSDILVIGGTRKAVSPKSDRQAPDRWIGPAGSMLPAWRRDDNQGPLALCITARGLAAIGIDKAGALPETPLTSERTEDKSDSAPDAPSKGQLPSTGQQRTDAQPPVAREVGKRPGNSRQGPTRGVRSSPA
jgi:hypothetical protein